MRTLIIILVAAFWFANVPTFVAHATDTTAKELNKQDDDVFTDEESPEMPEVPDEITLEDGSTPSTAPAEPAPEAQPNTSKAEPAKKPAEKHAAKVEKKEVKKEEKKEERKTASTGGFKVMKADCKMHAEANDASAVLTTVKGSKKIWTEKHSDGWVKAFRKDGHGYLSINCFEF